jgi:hypothetical protein
MFQALLLIAFGAISRLLPHAWNLVPMGAIALFAGSRLPKRLAWSVPLFAMILSDIVLDQKHGSYFHAPNRWVAYGTFALIALMGVFATGSKAKVLRLAGLSIAGSILFFVTSNFGCWAWPEGTNYPATVAGLIECYTAGLPFIKNTILADLIGTAALFGLAPIVSRAWRRWIVAVESPSPSELATVTAR